MTSHGQTHQRALAHGRSASTDSETESAGPVPLVAFIDSYPADAPTHASPTSSSPSWRVPPRQPPLGARRTRRSPLLCGLMSSRAKRQGLHGVFSPSSHCSLSYSSVMATGQRKRLSKALHSTYGTVRTHVKHHLGIGIMCAVAYFDPYVYATFFDFTAY